MCATEAECHCGHGARCGCSSLFFVSAAKYLPLPVRIETQIWINSPLSWDPSATICCVLGIFFIALTSGVLIQRKRKQGCDDLLSA